MSPDRTVRRAPPAALLTILSIVLGCNGPVFLFPGGSLDGAVAPAPDDWAFAGDSGTMQLETDPAEPYSVNVAFTVLEGHVYVNAGGTETRWVRNMTGDPRVRIRIDGSLYELVAVRVVDGDEIRAFAQAWTAQSFFRRDPLGYDEVWLYRLEPR